MKMLPIINPIFNLGEIVATRGIVEILSEEEMHKAIQRHATGDWGVIPDDDKPLNEEGLKTKDRIMSAYTSKENIRFWVITDYGHEVTTLLLPDEY